MKAGLLVCKRNSTVSERCEFHGHNVLLCWSLARHCSKSNARLRVKLSWPTPSVGVLRSLRSSRNSWICVKCDGGLLFHVLGNLFLRRVGRLESPCKTM